MDVSEMSVVSVSKGRLPTVMKIFIPYVFVGSVLCACIGMPQTASADLVAGSATLDAVALQTLTVTPGSPLTGAPFDIPAGTNIGLRSSGSFTIGWNNEVAGVASVSSFSGVFFENHPDLGLYDLFTVGDGPGATFSGELSNIVSDSNDELVSADVTISTTFSVTFRDASLGNPSFYTPGVALFEGAISADGSLFFESPDPDEVDIFFANPLGADSLAVISTDRTVFSPVPEPSTLAVCAGVVGLFTIRRRRQ